MRSNIPADSVTFASADHELIPRPGPAPLHPGFQGLRILPAVAAVVAVEVASFVRVVEEPAVAVKATVVPLCVEAASAVVHRIAVGAC